MSCKVSACTQPARARRLRAHPAAFHPRVVGIACDSSILVCASRRRLCRSGRDGGRGRRRRPRERRRFHLRCGEGHARDRQLYDHPRPWHGLHAAAAGSSRAVAVGCCGRRQQCTAAHQFPDPDRSCVGPHRDHGSGAVAHHLASRRPRGDGRGIRPPGACLADSCEGRRSITACGTHGSGGPTWRRMAGLEPAGVLCEILNETGDRANRDELVALARRHGLEIISIEQLIAHRRVSEKLVHRAAEADLPTRYGEMRIIVYGVKYESQEPGRPRPRRSIVGRRPAGAAAFQLLHRRPGRFAAVRLR